MTAAASVVSPAPARDAEPPRTAGSIAAALVRAVRPRQWVKQVLVVAAPASAGVLGSASAIGDTAIAALTFTMCAGGTYLVNDARDVEADRRHPTKSRRPIASGALPVGVGWAAAVVLLLGGVGLGWALAGWRLAAVLAVYAVLTIAYSVRLKHVAVVELMVVALGFVLRALAGAAAVRVPLSEWFVIVASFGSLFMVVGKRYAEATVLLDGAQSRRILAEYPVAWLRQVRDICVSVTLLAYCLFAFERGGEVSVPGGGAAVATTTVPWYQLSILPVTLGLLRYALLLERGQGGAPEEVVLRDRTLLLSGVAWAVLFGLGVARV